MRRKMIYRTCILIFYGERCFRYRANRVDISLFAYQMASKETISFLINKLTEAVNKNNEYR